MMICRYYCKVGFGMCISCLRSMSLNRVCGAVVFISQNEVTPLPTGLPLFDLCWTTVLWDSRQLETNSYHFSVVFSPIIYRYHIAKGTTDLGILGTQWRQNILGPLCLHQMYKGLIRFKCLVK